MRPILATLLVCMLSAPAWARQGDPAESPRPTFKSGVDLVTVTAVVRDRHGRPVSGLSRADFEVSEAGERRNIIEFRSDVVPASVAVLFDISGSMEVGSKLADARAAVQHLLSWLDPGRDEVALFAFDTSLRELQPFTTDPSAVSRRIDALRAFGSTSLYDAIAQAGQRLVARGGPRRAVVVVTDGRDNASRLTAPEVSGIASAIDVPVYVIAVVSPIDNPAAGAKSDAPNPVSSEGPLDSLASWTGGQLFVVSAPAHASLAARQIVTELRHQYLMAFEPGPRAGWHPLSVRIRQKDLVVSARSGYIVGARHTIPP